MGKFLIEKHRIVDNRVQIEGQDARHIFRILRMKKGDRIALTDGNGMDYPGIILKASPNQIDLEIGSERPSETESFLKIRVCSGMLKHQKMDEIIKNLTQLGISEWVPFFCERSIPHPEAKALKKNRDRWMTIAREAVKQCRRSRIPDIRYPVSFDTLLDMTRTETLKIAFWEGSNRSLKSLDPSFSTQGSQVSILIGPEGGFSDLEIKMARENGFTDYSLGPRILRAENASACACALVQHILGDM